MLDKNTRKHLTMYKKMSSGSLKNVLYKMYQIIYLIYRYEENLVVNGLQWLICNKYQLFYLWANKNYEVLDRMLETI